jgi:hypothetical protein
MADKKFERGFRPVSPTQKMEAALSDSGTRTQTEPAYERGKADLVDKFRQREERWRTEQALRDQASANSGLGKPAAPEAEAGHQAESEPDSQAGDQATGADDGAERQ